MGDKIRSLLPTYLVAENNIQSDKYDCIVLVNWAGQVLKQDILSNAVKSALDIDPGLKTEVGVIPLPGVPAGRLVFAPTGPLNVDYDDVRSLAEAAAKGLKRAVKAGFRKPLLLLQQHSLFQNGELVILLGALESIYVPLQTRENKPDSHPKLDFLGIYGEDFEKTKQLIDLACILESGRYVARDIGGPDPERMAPPMIQKYVEELFADSNIKIETVSDPNVIAKEFPLFEAVNRAASIVERHRGRIMFLEYVPKDLSKVKDTLFLVGKGVTYDTGGANIKTGGSMLGMCRDKCGAAAVVGFMQIVRALQPEDVRVVAGISLVRNSVGSNCYVADELIQGRSGALVRIINTDAEGRIAMADVLCKLKEEALKAVNPHLFTIATLTGHAILTVGKGYSIVADNGPARNSGIANRLQSAGANIGDPFEISVLRREDIKFAKSKFEDAEEDFVQSNFKLSGGTSRGHQGAAGIILAISGLDKHGSADAKPLKYSYVDIAASSGDLPYPATGAPVLAFANAFLLNKN